MMKKVLMILAVGIFVAMSASSVYAVEAFTSPTGLHGYDQARAYNGYTMFTPFRQNIAEQGDMYITYLIDMNGNVVHKWYSPYPAGLYAYLMEDGNIIRGGQDPNANAADTYRVLSGPRCGRVDEYDWDSNSVWSVTHYSEDSLSHHDFQRIWNKTLQEPTTIFLTFERMTAQDAIDNGADPIYEDDYTADGAGWSLDGLYEVNMAGETIWSWSFADHMCQDYDATKPNFGVISEMPGKIDINWLTPYGGPNSDWTHCNSLDYNEEMDHFVLNAKHMSEFYVVDHGGTFVANDYAASKAAAASDDGDFLYRFGNPSVYQQGLPPGYNTEGDHQMFASHDIQWIRNAAWTGGPELPGGGNFLIYDNGTWRPIQTRSTIVEINPFIMDADGNLSATYVNPPDAGYGMWQNAAGQTNRDNNQVVWRYKSVLNNSFYSYYISGQQRQPNGNTLIMSGATGHMFEVTPDGDVVWEYLNPSTNGGMRDFQTDADGRGTFSTFRCYRYGPDHPGLIGRDLTPMGPLTDFNSEMGDLQSSVSGVQATEEGVYSPYYPYR